MQKIAKKFVEVMRECSHVAKNGTNDFHRYKYATAADVLEKVNASLTKHGLSSVVTPNLLNMQQVTTAKGNVEQLATVEVVITLIDSESGETLTLKGLDSGQDSGDLPLLLQTTPKLILKPMKSCNLRLRIRLAKTAARISLNASPITLNLNSAKHFATIANALNNPSLKRKSSLELRFGAFSILWRSSIWIIFKR